jgi:hypothetical protein
MAVTKAEMKTATSIAKPSIQAVVLLLGEATPTYTAIVTNEATIKIRRVKSSRASQSS